MIQNLFWPFSIETAQVCSRAFILLSGVSSGAIQEARKRHAQGRMNIHKLVLLSSTSCYSHLMTGVVTAVPKSQLGTWMMIQNEKRASKYLVTWIFEALLLGMSFDIL